MKLWQKLLISVFSFFVLVIGGAYVTYTVKNQPFALQEPNYFSFYKQQDTKPEGKVGIYISQMILPEDFREELYYNVFYKPLKIIPWPIRELIKLDNGTPLYDENRYFEFTEFTPTRLLDHKGNDLDDDGVPYIEKYKQGLITFVEGKKYTPGYFIYKEKKAGMPTAAAELIAKARIYYHGEGAGMVDGKLPEEQGIQQLIGKTMDRVQAKYGEIDWRWANTDLYDEARAAMFELLDNGADTIIFAPPRPIMSHYEEFNASVRQGSEYIEEWRELNGNKPIKKIIAPQLADFPILRQAYLNLLRHQLNDIPEGSSVKVVASFHGMPWELVENEAWLELSKPYLDAMMADIDTILNEEYSFSKTAKDLTQDHFAEMTERFGSTNEAFWRGINEGYDYVINMPVEFITENTDTLFAHAFINFEGFDEFDVYEPIDYKNWEEPLVRKYKQDNTTVIYTSVPVGEFSEPLVAAHFQSIDSLLSQSLTPLASWDESKEKQKSKPLTKNQKYAYLD